MYFSLLTHTPACMRACACVCVSSGKVREEQTRSCQTNVNFEAAWTAAGEERKRGRKQSGEKTTCDVVMSLHVV